jgi:hypothetical protein
MTEAAQAFAAHCLSDPTHEIALLAVSPHFAKENARGQWMAHHWVGKNMKVRPSPIPEGVDLGAVIGAAIVEEPTSNIVLWLIGLRAGASRLNVRMLVTSQAPNVLADSDQWAMREIASYAHELAGLPEVRSVGTAPDASLGRRQGRSSSRWGSRSPK